MSRFVIIAAALCACHSGHSAGSTDEIVGDPCSGDRDCAHRCFVDQNDHFPDGFCSLTCSSDADCTSDTVCTATNGGVCLFVCPPFDCGFLGPNWHCSNRDHAGGGKVNVCIGG